MDTLILIKSMVISKIRPRRRYQCMVGRDHRFWAVKGVWVTCHGILLLPLYRSQAVSRSVRSMYRMRFCPGSKFEAECIRYSMRSLRLPHVEPCGGCVSNYGSL